MVRCNFGIGGGRNRYGRNRNCQEPVACQRTQAVEWLVHEGGRMLLRLLLPVAGLIFRKAVQQFQNRKLLRKEKNTAFVATRPGRVITEQHPAEIESSIKKTGKM